MKKLLVTGFLLLCFSLSAQVLQPLGNGLPGKVVASYAAGNEYLALYDETSTTDPGDYTVARWNGAYWSYFPGLALPNALSNAKYNYQSVVLYQGDMYVGAFIDGADQLNDVIHLWKWNGTGWSQVSGAVNSKNYGIQAMTVFDNKLIIAGRFQNTMGPIAFQNIVAFDGSNWSYLDTNSNPNQHGTDGFINTLVVSGNRLYIGGRFTNFGGQSVNNIAFYTEGNGNWGPYGNPFYKGEILELASYGNKQLAAIGNDSFGNRAIRIFDGSNWSTADLAFTGFTVNKPTTIAGASDYLLIGGEFVKDGDGTSLLRYEAGTLNFTGNRITGDFKLGQRGSEAFIWGEFLEQNTEIRNISKIETNAGEVTGYLYFDKNQDCTKDGSEYGIPKAVIRFSDNTGFVRFALTDAMGHFAVALPEGNYNITTFPGRHWINNCASNYAVKIRKGSYSWVSLGQFMPPNTSDASVSLGAALPPNVKAGDEIKLSLVVKNTGNTVINGPTVHFKHHSKLTAFKSEPPADNYDGGSNIATYSLVNLGMGESKTVIITLKIPADATTEDIYETDIRTGSLFTSGDAWAADNYDTVDLNLSSGVDGSILKTADLGGEVNFKVKNLGYKVRFVNNSKEFVKRVVVTDTIDRNVKIDYILVTNAYPTDVNLSMSHDGILVVEYPSANLATLESNPNSSNGFVTYTVYLLNQLKHNDQVHNRAKADFDSKWYGISNTVSVTMKDPNIGIRNIQGPISRVYPNPAKTEITVELNAIQSGIAEVIDNSGRVVATSVITGNAARINIAGLNAGIYTLRCGGGSAIVSVIK